jgi:HK97 family phage major capsid protein
MSIQALRERKNSLVNDARKLLADMGDRVWPKDQQAAYDALNDDIERLNGQISAHQRELDRQAEEIVLDGKPGAGAQNSGEKKVLAIFDKWARGGDRQVQAEEWALIRNTMSTTTPSEGGFTVQTTIASTVAEAVKTFGGMRQVAEVFVTERGEPIQYPTTDGTSEIGEIVAQNTAATDLDPSFGTIGLEVYKFSSKVITLPIELLQDSNIDVLGTINARLRTRLGRIQNSKFTVGSGSNEPRGLITALATGKTGATGTATSITFDDLVDLQESIDDGYDQAMAKWMLHQQSRRVIRKLKDTTGRPIWTPGYEGGITKGAPDELLGRPVVINNDMATMAANAKSLAYGDFSYYKVRDALDIQLYRFNDSAYAKKGQVGFLAFMRSGGNWVDAGGAAKVFVNSAT